MDPVGKTGSSRSPKMGDVPLPLVSLSDADLRAMLANARFVLAMDTVGLADRAKARRVAMTVSALLRRRGASLT